MTAQQATMTWPKARETVWVVHHHHTWDAENNNQYYPVPRKVSSVDGDTVRFGDGSDRKVGECYVSQEDCKRACPAPHPDE